MSINMNITEDGKMKAVNIQLDTDGDQELLKELPTEIDIPD